MDYLTIDLLKRCRIVKRRKSLCRGVGLSSKAGRKCEVLYDLKYVEIRAVNCSRGVSDYARLYQGPINDYT